MSRPSVWAALEEITASFIYGTSCATELRRHDVTDGQWIERNEISASIFAAVYRLQQRWSTAVSVNREEIRYLLKQETGPTLLILSTSTPHPH